VVTNPSEKLLRAARESRVAVTGTVADVRPYLSKATVCVVPLRVGGGTRLKIFEALAMGKAVVSTSVGAEGLPLKDGTHFLRADAPSGFAAAVTSLLHSRSRRRELGLAGQLLVREHYSWSQVTRDFAAHCRRVVTNRKNLTTGEQQPCV
jgi:glycosyltransferase involved in cell wall biosynthesis